MLWSWYVCGFSKIVLLHTGQLKTVLDCNEWYHHKCVSQNGNVQTAKKTQEKKPKWNKAIINAYINLLVYYVCYALPETWVTWLTWYQRTLTLLCTWPMLPVFVWVWVTHLILGFRFSKIVLLHTGQLKTVLAFQTASFLELPFSCIIYTKFILFILCDVLNCLYLRP
jgi:hypothetical protein